MSLSKNQGVLTASTSLVGRKQVKGRMKSQRWNHVMMECWEQQGWRNLPSEEPLPSKAFQQAERHSITWEWSQDSKTKDKTRTWMWLLVGVTHRSLATWKKRRWKWTASSSNNGYWLRIDSYRSGYTHIIVLSKLQFCNVTKEAKQSFESLMVATLE